MNSVHDEMDSNKSTVVCKPSILAVEDIFVDKVLIERSLENAYCEHDDSHEKCSFLTQVGKVEHVENLR